MCLDEVRNVHYKYVPQSLLISFLDYITEIIFYRCNC